jgi:hypothetical protein
MPRYESKLSGWALRRKNSEQAIPYPPDGQAREWWQRLKNAFGTTSSAFVEASLYQLIAAARLPNSGICEIAVNASLAFIEGAKPRDEIECALVIQMACTHSAAMAVLNRLGGAAGRDRSVAAMASAAARLLRAYATQVEALRRLRHGGSQTLRVEHVHVNEGGQAVIRAEQDRRRRAPLRAGARPRKVCRLVRIITAISQIPRPGVSLPFSLSTHSLQQRPSA